MSADFPADDDEEEEEDQPQENMQYIITEDDGSVREWIVEEGDEVENCVNDISQAVEDFEPPEVFAI